MKISVNLRPIEGSDEAARLGLPSYLWRAGQERRLELVRRHVSLEGRRVLDLGCGVGMYTAAFRRYTHSVYGLEIDFSRAQEAAEKSAGVVLAQAEELPFAGASFDVVFSHEVLEHVRDDRAAVREAARVLRPGGHLVIFVPNRWYPFETHGFHWRGKYHFGLVPLVNYLPDFLRRHLCPHVRAYSWRTLRNLLAQEGLRPTFHTRIYPGYDNISVRHPKLGAILRRLTYALEGTPLSLFGLSHFVVAEKSASFGDYFTS
ncbi:MAG: methyltransferase domain-containing protein [Anaerolineae bacterium]